MNRLAELVAGGEDRIIQILLHYTLGRGYARYSSTLEEAWRMSVSVLSSLLAKACETWSEPPELSPDEDYSKDPLAEFGIIEAQRHRERGIDPVMFLGLLKYYRQSYLDLVIEAGLETEYSEKCRRFVDRFYDRIELGICGEWIKTEAALRESEESYRVLFDGSTYGILATDIETGRFVYANPSICRMLGYSATELLQLSIAAIHPKDSLGRVITELESLLHGEKKLSSTLPCLRKDGTVFYADIAGAGNIIQGRSCAVGFFADVTERKQALDALRETNEYLDNLINYANAPIIVWDPEFRITRFNHAFEKLTGRAAGDVIGMNIEILFPPALVRSSMQLIEKTLLGERWETVEISILHVDGALRTVLWNSATIFATDGITPVATIAQGHDITERKRAEEELGESEKRYRSLFEMESDAILLIDNQTGRILEANRAASLLYGYSREELLAQNNTDLSAEPEETQQVTEGNPIVSDNAVTIPLRIHRKKDGTEFPVEITGRFFIRDGRPVHIAAIRDITERKQAEEEKAKLEAQNRQLQKAESLGRMAGAIAHHFNNQLGAVMGNLELAMDDLPRGTRISRKHLTAAMKAARQAAEVSGLMLTYLGQTPGKREPLDLSEACRRSLPLLRAAMPEDVVLETDLPSPGPIISANANQIQQVLTNLVTNAWEAIGDDRGAIRLTVKTVSSADIPAAHRFPIDWQPQDNAYACLEVADAGCGIADKDIEKLFDPFFSSKFTGRGLGLAVVLGIVRAHGGVVTVESEPGRGSVFRVFFPVSAEEVPRRPDQAAQAPEIEGGGTVLLVEDEEMVRNMAATMLTRLGFTVLEAKDGVEAVEVFRQHQDEIRCVLCDLTMPRMNGWETLAALRKLAPGTPGDPGQRLRRGPGHGRRPSRTAPGLLGQALPAPGAARRDQQRPRKEG